MFPDEMNFNVEGFGEDVHWSSDWCGDEVGYPDIDVVGLYIYREIYMYIDISTNTILEMWTLYEDEEIY